ncbi:hypothetical protein KB206_16885 [Microvirga sp. STS02]|uniref:hypothetical protein n=1 Tax=Hymenobacter negativus TaxID=2795026 RepID=UPI0018DC763F|nr:MULTISPECIES: hypothetical protein [Bacteria]MBH8570571.1 hypothetical protein [Hymenobacter negativus]MBR7210309.1 hypothetical protein [Microvirga sp. STS02]
MMHPLRFLCTLLAGCLLLLSACSKKEDPAPGGISGTVTPAAAIATITATGPSGTKATAAVSTTGTYQFTGLAAGSYVLSFAPAATYIAPAPVTAVVAAGATTQVPAVAVQQTSGSLSGTIAPADAVTRVTVFEATTHFTATATVTSTGAFSFPSLPPGTYYVDFNATYLGGITTFEFLAYYPPSQLGNVVVVSGQNTTLPVVTAVATRANKLSTPKWRITGYLLDVAGANGAVDIYAQMPTCERDNFYRFNIPNQYIKDEGATKCSASDPQTVAGTWAFDANQSNIDLTVPGTASTRSILYSLTATTLQLGTSGTTATGAAYTAYITYTAF